MWQDKSQKDTDRHLIANCLLGKASAWEQLIERYQSFIYGIALRMGLQLQDADDIFQNVCLKLCLHLNEVRDHDNLKPWLAAVTRQECHRLFRRRMVDSLESIPNQAFEGESPEEMIFRSEQIESVRRGLATLSPECQELLGRLYRSESVTYAKIAEEMGMPLGSIGPRRARCLERLKKKLEALGH